MGLFSFFKKGKKKKQSVEELSASYDAELNPLAPTPDDDDYDHTPINGAIERGPITLVLDDVVAESESERHEEIPEYTAEKDEKPGPLTSVIEANQLKERLTERINKSAREAEERAMRELQEKEAAREATARRAKIKAESERLALAEAADAQSREAAEQAVPSKGTTKRHSFFGKLRTAVSKTRRVFSRRVAAIVGLGQKIDGDLLDELEEALLESDIGVITCDILMEDIRSAWKAGEIETGDDIFPFLKADLKHRLGAQSPAIATAKSGPTVILVVGVNGAGKTTSIAKMARIFVKEGKKVLLGAGDTFRAAAVQQLVTWSTRIGCQIVTGNDGVDPASVAFKACEEAIAGDYDVLIIDTAGRLHTQKGLMEELSKICRVIQKQIPDAPHETIMVIDATTGQNAVQQAKLFKETANVTGVFLAKLDGTAKGGAVLSIDRAVGIPVKFVGVGETFEDVQRFNAHAFVDALFDESFDEADE